MLIILTKVNITKVYKREVVHVTDWNSILKKQYTTSGTVFPIQRFWHGCGNHKIALCFKHLLNKIPSIIETDALFLQSLWKFFEYRTLAKNLLEESDDENVLVPVAPSVTLWITHERPCKSLTKSYRQYISLLYKIKDDLQKGVVRMVDTKEVHRK